MRCQTCKRTTLPRLAKTFCGLNFCAKCYDALELKNLEKKEADQYFLSLSGESDPHLVEALVTVASKFDKKEWETLLSDYIHVLGREPPRAQDVLPILLAVKALQESTGLKPITTVGKLTLLSITEELTSDMARAELEQLTDEDSNDIALTAIELEKRICQTCIGVLRDLGPSSYTELIHEILSGLHNLLDLLCASHKISPSGVMEGTWLMWGKKMTDILLENLGSEPVFHGWKELKKVFSDLEEDFRKNEILLTVSEADYPGDIYLVIDQNEGKVFITTQWKEIKEMISSHDFDRFRETHGELPSFVLEKAAGGIEPLQKFFEDALSQNPEDVGLIVSYTYLVSELDFEKALHFLKKKVSEMPDNVPVLMNLAELLMEYEKPDQTLEIYEKVQKIEPENCIIPFFMGNVHKMEGDLKRAKEAYEQALRLDPLNPFLINAINETEMEAVISDIEKLISEEDYEKALLKIDAHFDPFDITVFHYYRGSVLSRMGESKEALTLLTDYLDIHPEDEEGWLEKAGIYLKLRNFAAAARCFRHCFMLNPHDIEPLVWEALCHKSMGQSRSYKRCINDAKKIDLEGTKALLKEFKFF